MTPRTMAQVDAALRFSWDALPTHDALADIARGTFTGCTIAREGTTTVVRGIYARMAFLLRFELAGARRIGQRPYTVLQLETDTGGAPLYLGSAGADYGPRETHVRFAHHALEGQVLAGAPRYLVAGLARGPLSARLGAIAGCPGAFLSELDVGPYAVRRGVRTDGIHLRTGGWPLDERALTYLLDTLMVLRGYVRAAAPTLGCASVPSYAIHPEVAAHLAHLTQSRRRSRTIAAGVAVATVAAAVGAAVMQLSAF